MPRAKKLPKPDTWYIDVFVEGGCVQDVGGVPKNVVLRVIDKDSDGAPNEDLSTINDGYEKPYLAFVSEWPWDEGGYQPVKVGK